MFDLNLDIIVSTNLPEQAKSQTADSGTLISSVVNDGEDSNSNSISTLNFDILNKNRQNISEIKGQCSTNQNHLATTELFPVTGGFGAVSSSATSRQWLNLSVSEANGRKEVGVWPQQQQKQGPVKKSRRGPRSRSSQYRGVTFYRRTGRWESHIWDSGKQVYLGGFDTAHVAARAYDRAAIRFRGVDADINFNINDYEEDMKQMKDLTKEEFIHILRRQSNGFSWGSSKYRGVTLHKCGRWEARMGKVLGKKYMYLGLFNSEVEAARAYDKAAMECNGREAVTNFEPNTYGGEITLDTNGGGCDCNLDLNLYISPPSAGPKGNESVRNLHFNWSAYEFPDAKSPKIESYTSASICAQNPHSLTMASKCSSIWPGIYSGFSPNYEERVTGKRTEAITSPEFSNWASQMQSHGGITQVPLFSAAASSGFSSIAPPFKNSILPSNTQSKR